MLTRAQGVGARLAVRILAELHDKAAELSVVRRVDFGAPSTDDPVTAHDAVSALVNLGYRRGDALAWWRMRRNGSAMTPRWKRWSRPACGSLAHDRCRLIATKMGDGDAPEVSLRPKIAGRLCRSAAIAGQSSRLYRGGTGARRGARFMCCSTARPGSARRHWRRSWRASSASGFARHRAGDREGRRSCGDPDQSGAADVLFIDEIHRLSPAVEEILYPAIEDFELDLIIGEGPAARSVRIELSPFTLIGATTRSGLITTPLRERFGIPLRLNFYSPGRA